MVMITVKTRDIITYLYRDDILIATAIALLLGKLLLVELVVLEILRIMPRY